MRTVAIVPMRHSSERVKGKNYRPLGGRPLFHHIVGTLFEVPSIDVVVIDTDSALIEQSAKEAFPDIQIVRRPERLFGGDVPMNDVLLNTIEQVPANRYVQTHSTNPLLRAQTVEDALQAMEAGRPDHDSLFTVTALQTRLWTPDGKAINHDPSVLLRTQDLPPVMEENSCLYVFDGETLRRRRNRLGDRPLLHPIAANEAWDIDEEVDWTVVEALYAHAHGATA